MKINKLLFFFIALFSISACTTEYVDNGVKPNVDILKDRILRAELKATAAKYVGDTFEFQASMNGVDVTKTTKFKVNGTSVKDNTYIPHRVGSHSVIATMEDFEVTFKFNVLSADEGEPEPEPTTNRIEYEGISKPVTKTVWMAIGDPVSGSLLLHNVQQGNNGPNVMCTKWILVSFDGATIDKSKNLYYTMCFIPQGAGAPIVYPHESTDMFLGSGHVIFDGQQTAIMWKNTYDFISVTKPTNGSTAEYNATTILGDNKEVKLFWDGPYTYEVIKDPVP